MSNKIGHAVRNEQQKQTLGQGGDTCEPYKKYSNAFSIFFLQIINTGIKKKQQSIKIPVIHHILWFLVMGCTLQLHHKVQLHSAGC